MKLFVFKQHLLFLSLKSFILILLFLSSTNTSFSQERCAAQENLSIEELSKIKDNIVRLSRKTSTSARTSTTYQIPLHFVIVNDGNGNPPTPPSSETIISSLPDKINTTNSVFTNDMEFFLCGIDEINSSTYYNLSFGEDLNDLYNLLHVEDAINVYIINSFAGSPNIAGFAGVNSIEKRVFVRGDASGYTLAHELGHYFDLLHTHTTILDTITGSNGQDSIILAVPLPTEPCIGDNICDTPTDPGPDNCTSSCSAGNCSFNGYTYSPNRQNVMSYYSDNCGQHFSSDQLTVMQNNLLTESNKAYLLTAPTSCVPFLIAEEGKVEKVANFSGTSTIPIRLTDVTMTESGNSCIEETNGSYPNYLYEPLNCDYLVPENAIVQIEPQRDKTHQWDNATFAGKNGLDIFDTQNIQNHILGNSTLGLPYAQLAADVNRSGAITSYDNYLIQRVILGNDPTFTVTGSWQHVPSHYLQDNSFKNSFDANPFTATWGAKTYNGSDIYLNDIDIDLNNSSASDSDTWSFHAVKMGDVDFNSFLSNQTNYRGQEQAESRNGRFSKMDYFVEPLGRNCIKEGRTFILEIKAEDKLEMAAYQFGISFDTESLEVRDVHKSGFGNFDMENFGLKQLDKGELKTLWMNELVKNVKLNSTSKSLFKIRLKALQDICNLEDVIRLDDKVLENFLLDENGNRVRAHLVFKPHLNSLLNKETTNANSLTNIYPNPINTDLSVEFELTNTEKVWISITDQYGGRILKEETYESGSHRILIGETNNLKSGVLFYTISLGEKIYKGTVIKH